jgi:hypothetical protein
MNARFYQTRNGQLETGQGVLRRTHRSDISVCIVLLAATRDSNEEEQHPGNANFGPHLEVNAADTRVQAGAPTIGCQRGKIEGKEMKLT